MYKNLLFMCVLLLSNGLFAQNYQLTEKSIIDSGTDRIWTGESNIHLDGNGDLNVFYLVQKNDTDFVYHVTSSDMGSTWSTPDRISFYKHGGGSQYHINYVNSSIDNSGKFHIVFNYRGLPLYSASSSYPPEHIAYATNESGTWITYMNVMDDSLALMNSGQSNSTSYCYGANIISQNGTEYLSAFDYAWFATKSHVIHAKRTSMGNFHARGEAVVTYERGAIDKYTLRVGRIIGDGNSFYTFWINRFTGKVNIKKANATGWDSTQTIHTFSNTADGIPNTYQLSAPNGANGNLKAFFTRWEDDTTIQAELFVLDKVGSNWNVYSKPINEKTVGARACVKNNTLYGMYLTPNYDTIRMIEHNTVNGFSSIAHITPPNSDLILSINLLPNSFDPILYVRRDSNNKYTLAVGTLPTNVGTNEISNDAPRISIYPNPIDNELNISYMGNSIMNTVQIYSLSGMMIKEVKLNKKQANISLSELHTGLYIIHAFTNDGHHTIEKFIKK